MKLKDVNNQWRQVFYESDIKPSLDTALRFANRRQDRLCPRYNDIFACFRYFPPTRTRIVIIGQDPYSDITKANGLAFSMTDGEITGSLKSIQAAVYKCCAERLANGNLTSWAKQGVLLLNSRLTTEQGITHAKGHKIWEPFTDALIKWIDCNIDGVVFLLWGNFAKSKARLINNPTSIVLEYTHPSPQSDATLPKGRRFAVGCDHFARVNKILTKQGEKPIKWGN